MIRIPILCMLALLVCGATLTAQNRVGIGTNTPFGKLTVSEETDWQLVLSNPGPSGSIWSIGASNSTWNAGGGRFVISRNFLSSNAYFTITSDGFVGINHINPGSSLHVGSAQGSNSRLRLGTSEWLQDGGGFEIEVAATLRSADDGLDNLGLPEKRWKNLYYSGALLQSSDRRLKTNIRPLQKQDAAMSIYQLQPVTYQYTNTAIDDATLTGFIAQDMQQVLPGLVYDPLQHAVRDEGPNGSTIYTYREGPLSINYVGLIPYLVAALQQQHEQLQAMSSLKKEVEDLKLLVQQLQQSIGRR